LPGEEAKSAGRGLLFIGAMLSAMLLGGMAGMARHFDHLTSFLIAEAAIAILCAVLMDARIRKLSWAPIEDASGSI
jgi:hypothetical protein